MIQLKLIIPNSLLFIMMFIGMQQRPLQAEPYIAVRTGFKCSQCHVNMTGGGKRTDFGNVFAQQFLNSYFVKKNTSDYFSPQLSSTISVGANLRMRNTIKYSYTHTDTAGLSQIAKGDNLLAMTEGNFYLEAKLIPKVLTFYFDQVISPDPGNREAFGLLKGLPFRGYFKAGKFLFPYGLRLWNDGDIFIRGKTGFTYSGPLLGAEIGFEPGNFSVSIAVSDNEMSGIAAWVRRHGRIGLSWQKMIEGTDSHMLGMFAGLHAGRFTLLGEVDRIESEEGITKEAYFAEINFLLLKGINFKTTYNLFNRNLDVPLTRDGQERITFGVEVFPIQFFQIAAFYNINRFIPQNLVQNQNTFTFELHFFF